MKNIIIILSAFLTGVGITTLFLSTQVSSHTVSNQVVSSPIELTDTHTQPSNTTQTYTYTITHVTGEDYYGISDSADDNVYFTDEYLQSTGTTKKGDTVQVTYDSQGELLYVDRITSAQPELTTVSTNSSDTQLTSESYTVTKVTDNPTNNDEYYAEKSDGTGVFFNSDYIQSIGKISIGDTVSVFFTTDDELAYVSLNR